MPMLGGVRPPIASLVVLLLVVAALTVIGLDGIHTVRIPQAVLNGEQQIAADTAVAGLHFSGAPLTANKAHALGKVEASPEARLDDVTWV